MVSAVLQFVLAAGVIILAGSMLVKFSDRIAEVTKLGRLFVGSLFLAGATSLPELFVDLSAIKQNMPDLAVGDLFGSSVANLLILAIADLMHKGTSPIFSKASARHALAGVISIHVTAIAGVSIYLGEHVESLTIFGFGLGTLAIAVSYLLGLRMILFHERTHFSSKSDEPPVEKASLSRAIWGYASAALAILVAAPFLAEAAGEIAQHTGLGKSFIGTTLVALSTSLPELVSTVTAVRRGAYDLALGNIFGSNTFNMLLLTPLDAFYPGALLAAASPIHLVTCFATIIITAVAIMGQVYQVEKRKKFIEPDALSVIVLVIFANVILYYLDS